MQVGAALDASCSPCAATVCGLDGYCCATEWDEICVGIAFVACGGGGGCPGSGGGGGGGCPGGGCSGGGCPNNSSNGCGGLTYAGQCSGSQLSWCDNGALASVDCASYGLSCGWNGNAGYYDCL